jgi:hypothetical protein
MAAVASKLLQLNHAVSRVPPHPLSSQEKVFQMSLEFYTLEPVMSGVRPISKMLSRHFYYYPSTK